MCCLSATADKGHRIAASVLGEVGHGHDRVSAFGIQFQRHASRKGSTRHDTACIRHP